MTTRKELVELGAVRPMASAGVDTLVLGEWRNGFYPVSWTAGARIPGGGKEPDEWQVHGILTAKPLTKDEILRALQ